MILLRIFKFGRASGLLLSVIGIQLLASGVLAQGGQPAVLLGTFGDWGAYSANSDGSKTCYALSQSRERRPGPGYIFVSFRPSKNVSNEVAVVLGFPTQEGHVRGLVDGKPFDFVTRGENAWMANAADEGRIVNAFVGGRQFELNVTSVRGVAMTEVYSLSGFTAAMRRAQQECDGGDRSAENLRLDEESLQAGATRRADLARLEQERLQRERFEEQRRLVEAARFDRESQSQFNPRPRPNTLAVVIGNRNYLEAPEVKFAHNDAGAFARYFSDVMGLEARKIIVENDVSSVGMARLFGRPGGLEGRLHNLARFVDEIYVFYSGHGVPEIQPGGAARGYLLPVDVPPGAPGFGAYALDDLISQLESLPVARVTLLIDACFSGLSEGGSLVPNVSGAFGVTVASPLQRAKVSVLAATAFEKPQLAHWLPHREQGAFTYLALSGLHGAADRAGDGRVTLSKLQRYIDEGLAFRGFDQRPSLVSGGEDDLIMDFSGAATPPQFERYERTPAKNESVTTISPEKFGSVSSSSSASLITSAQRAIFYEEDASNPQAEARAAAGSAVWHLDPPAAGAVDPSVRSVVQFGDAGMTMTMTIRRNLDPTLPASHTIELLFVPAADSGRNVRDIGLLQLKEEETVRGSPVAGLPVPVQDNFFLIGLSNIPSDIQRNTNLLTSRNWIDIPIRFAAGQRAIVSFEKGQLGAEMIKQAFLEWGQHR